MIRKLAYITAIILLSAKSFALAGPGMPYASSSLKSELNKLLDGQKEAEIRFYQLVYTLSVKKENFRNDQQFLQFVYRYIHRKHLKVYRTYATLDRTLGKEGVYDCLTGTLLYGLVLQELGYQVNVREFSYHVMLMVKTEENTFLIESTDPINGFTSGALASAERIEAYKISDQRQEKTTLYDFTSEIDNEITLTQLTGLHFYNRAVNSLNNMRLDVARQDIRKAADLYPSPRVLEILKLIHQYNSNPGVVAQMD